MIARDRLEQLRLKFGAAIQRADFPADNRLFVHVEPAAVKSMCQYIFRDLDARYVISIGVDDRPYSSHFLVAHNFAFDPDHLLCSVLVRTFAGPTKHREHFRRGAGGKLGRARDARPGRHRADWA